MAAAHSLPPESTVFGRFVRQVREQIARSFHLSPADITTILIEEKSQKSPPEILIEANCFYRSSIENEKLSAELEVLVRRFKGFHPGQIVSLSKGTIFPPS